MRSLLKGSTAGRRWLPDLDERKRVLTGIIERARKIKLGSGLDEGLSLVFRQYLI
jgi:hypothetical protein